MSNPGGGSTRTRAFAWRSRCSGSVPDSWGVRACSRGIDSMGQAVWRSSRCISTCPPRDDAEMAKREARVGHASLFTLPSSRQLSDEDRLQLRIGFGHVRLLVLEPLARVIPQHHFLVRDLHDVLGEERNL